MPQIRDIFFMGVDRISDMIYLGLYKIGIRARATRVNFHILLYLLNSFEIIRFNYLLFE